MVAVEDSVNTNAGRTTVRITMAPKDCDVCGLPLMAPLDPEPVLCRWWCRNRLCSLSCGSSDGRFEALMRVTVGRR